MANILDWHCAQVYTGQEDMFAAKIRERGGTAFVPKGITRPKNRPHQNKPPEPKEYNLFPSYVFYRCAFTRRGDGAIRTLTEKHMISHEYIDRLQAEIVNGKYDLAQKYLNDLKNMIGNKITYDNSLHPFHGQEMVLDILDGQMVGRIETGGKRVVVQLDKQSLANI